MKVTKLMRLDLILDSLLALGPGLGLLFIFTARTDTFFSWTINPPISAATLGGTFLGLGAAIFLASFAKTWANMRYAAYGTATALLLILIATVVHLDRFHFNSPNVDARTGAQIWMVVYILGLPLLLLAMWWQNRSGQALMLVAPQASFPSLLRGLYFGFGGILLLMTALIWLAPTVITSIWPWQLTPLVGRMVFAFLAGLGVALLLAANSNDLNRAKFTNYGCIGVALAEAAALAQYASSVAWASFGGVLYVALLLGLLLTGVIGLRADRNSR